MNMTLNTSIEPQFRTIDGLKIRFAESEHRDDHALLLSPWPESLHAFDQMWHRLAEHAHLVAVDLPGFGHSERRDSLLAPRAMGEFVVRLADEFGLENPHAVGPDIGTGLAVCGCRQPRPPAEHRRRQRRCLLPARARWDPQRLGRRTGRRPLSRRRSARDSSVVLVFRTRSAGRTTVSLALTKGDASAKALESRRFRVRVR
jgi:pimeloyl-ACP methyl ester carboxylesterase